MSQENEQPKGGTPLMDHLKQVLSDDRNFEAAKADAKSIVDAAGMKPKDAVASDISMAYEWCNASKVLDSPGKGEGWRHVCLRLAQAVELLQRENADLRKQVEAAKALFDEAKLFTVYSLDAGKTWIEHPFLEKVRLAVITCGLPDDEINRVRVEDLMQQLATLTAERDALKALTDDALGKLTAARIDRDRAVEERDARRADKADAARYRWLRRSVSNPAYAVWSSQFGVCHIHHDSLDEAIDSAIAQSAMKPDAINGGGAR